MEEIPRLFRGRTVSEAWIASKGATLPPDPAAAYCSGCDGLRISDRHNQSAFHVEHALPQAPAAARTAPDHPTQQPAATILQAVGPQLVQSIVGQLTTCPEFVATGRRSAWRRQGQPRPPSCVWSNPSRLRSGKVCSRRTTAWTTVYPCHSRPVPSPKLERPPVTWIRAQRNKGEEETTWIREATYL